MPSGSSPQWIASRECVQELRGFLTMFDAKQAPPAAAYLLGDHLDAALAAGEDLMSTALELSPPPASSGVELDDCQAALAEFITRMRALEAGLVARLVQARRRAEELPRDADLKPLVSLFLSGTVVLLDAVQEFGDPSGIAFDSGPDGFRFLRDRGLVPPDAGSLPMSGTLVADEEYLIAGRIRLGSLMDLVAAFLDALDMRFSLYDEEPDDVPVRIVEPPPPAAAAKLKVDRESMANRPQLVAEALEALYGRS
jgi:hypothetical protein